MGASVDRRTVTDDAPPRRTRIPPGLQAEYDRIGSERLAAEREVDRAYWRELIRVCIEMFAWTALGLFLLGMAFHVTDVKTGMVYFYAGQVVGAGGVVWSIYAAYRRGEIRGDW